MAENYYLIVKVLWLGKICLPRIRFSGPLFLYSMSRVVSIDRVRSRRIRAGQFDVSRIVKHVLVMVTRRYRSYFSLRRR